MSVKNSPDIKIKNKSLPVLRIVPLENIIIHEQIDQRRTEGLMVKMKNDGVLKDPPIVAKLEEEEKYVHLDGANRITTSRLLGCKDILVQVVDYFNEDEVKLDSWSHLTRMDKDQFLSQINKIKGIKVPRIDYETAGDLLKGRKILCSIFFRTKESFAIESGTDLWSRVEILNRVVDIYKSNIVRDIIERNEIANQIDDLFKRHEECNLAIIFPKFTPQEVMECAARSIKIPAGITRHMITNRALRLNFPLVILRSEVISLDQKNHLLEEFLREKSPRFYREPTILYDE